MFFTTSAYWQRGENDSALLLQHERWGGVSFVLACVCAGEGERQAKACAYLSKGLLKWFYALPKKRIARDPGPRLAGTAGKLASFIEKTDGEIAACGLLASKERVQTAGVLCAGPYFLLFCRGGCPMFLLQRRPGGGSIRPLLDQAAASGGASGDEGRMRLRPGLLEEDVGLFFATPSMVDCIGQEKIGECLDVTQTSGKAQTDRHLRELGRLAQERGGQNMTSVFLRTQREGGI